MEKFDLKKISMREKVIVLFTLVSLVGYGYHQFEYTVQEKRMKKVKTKLAQVDSSAAAMEKALVMMPDVVKTEKEITRVNQRITKLEGEIEAIKSKMRGSGTGVIREIQNEAALQKIVISSMRIRDRSLRRGKLQMKEISLILELRCGYRAMKHFLEFLDSYPALLSIESLEIVRNDEILPDIENRLHIKIFSL